MGHDPGDPTNRNLDAAIQQLRTKAAQSMGEPLPIRTVHAVGYQLVERIEVESLPARARYRDAQRERGPSAGARGIDHRSSVQFGDGFDQM